MIARAKLIDKRVDLSKYGIQKVDVGTTMWSLYPKSNLYISPEHALKELGFVVVITIDGIVFVEHI
jgi:hypothetical protein